MINTANQKLTPAQPLTNELALPGVWNTLQILDIPASRVHFAAIDRPEKESELAREVRMEKWESALKAKILEVRSANAGNTYEIAPDPATGQNSVFQFIDGKPHARIMYDGNTISTQSSRLTERNGEFSLEVFPIKYSEWTSCTDPRYSELNPSNCGVGISVLMETTDRCIPLTIRGVETPVYPGRLYSPGGGPKPGEKTSEALLSEILEETGLRSGSHFNPTKMIMLAYVSDIEHQGSARSRPELVAYLPLEISSRKFSEVRDVSLKQKKVPEADVWGIQFVFSDVIDLKGAVALDGKSMCPPTEAALTHLIRYKLAQLGKPDAEQEMAELMKRLETRAQKPFQIAPDRLIRQ